MRYFFMNKGKNEILNQMNMPEWRELEILLKHMTLNAGEPVKVLDVQNDDQSHKGSDCHLPRKH